MASTHLAMLPKKGMPHQRLSSRWSVTVSWTGYPPAGAAGGAAYAIAVSSIGWRLADSE